MEILDKRLSDQLKLRFDLIGLSSVFNDDAGHRLSRWPEATFGTIGDVRLRVAAQHLALEPIERLLREVTAMWTCGPAGGGGVRVNKRQRLSTTSCLIARKRLPATFKLLT
jgi:hypothetical protein